MRCLIFASLFLTACTPPIRVGAPPPPREWLVCATMPGRPDLAPLQAYTSPDGETVYVKRDTDARDLVIAGYVLDLRAAWFDCHNKLGMVRDYHEKTAE